MSVRGYERADAAGITRLFHETVHAVNRKDYSPEQLQAWAPAVPDVSDSELWHARMSTRCTLVAEEAGEVMAFAELEADGHLDMLYCRRDSVGRGVGSLLYRAAEREAGRQGLERIFAEASFTARPFFERQGFSVVREQTVARLGVELTNFAMDKRLWSRSWGGGGTFLC